MTTTTKLKAAYSYTRFSTPEQAEGRSKRRQDAMVAEWLQDHPEYELDTSLNLHDAGVSAYRGANRKKGALGKFLKAVELRKVNPGSALLVENWDRFTRECPYDAEPTLRAIFSAGITIVNLEEDESYDEATVRDDYKKFRSILDDIDRAHRESKRRGKLISDMWEDKRQAWYTWVEEVKKQPDAPPPKPFTTRGPDWLEWEDGRWKLVEHQVAAVKQIFEWKAQGVGGETIIKRLNGNLAWRRPEDWYRGYIKRVVRNPEVLGVFAPTKNGEKCKPIPGYFPQIIDRDLWNRAQATMDRNGELPGHGGGVKGPVNNLFREIVWCGRCGSAMRFRNKGPAPRRGHSHYLKCSDAHRGLECDGTLVPYHRLEPLLLYLCRTLPELMIDTATQASINLQSQSIRVELAGIEKEVTNLRRAIARTDDDARAQELEDELGEAIARRAAVKTTLTSLDKRAHTVEAIAQHVANVDEIVEKMEQLEAEERWEELAEYRERLHIAVIQLIKRIEITPKEERNLSVMVKFMDLPAILLLIDARGGIGLVEDIDMMYRIDGKGNEIKEDPERTRRVNALVAKSLRRKGLNPSHIGG